MKYPLAVFGLLLFTVGCSSNPAPSPTSTTTTSTTSASVSVTGSWEATLTNSNVAATPNDEYVELNLSQSGSTVSGSVLGPFVIVPPGDYSCTPTLAAQPFSGSLSGNVLSGTVAVCGGTATFTGTVADDGTISGTYTSTSSSVGDAGSGTFTTQPATALSGTYAGTLVYNTVDKGASLTVVENSSGGATASGTFAPLNLTSNEILSGNVYGNVADVAATGAIESPDGDLTLFLWLHGGSLYVYDEENKAYLGSVN